MSETRNEFPDALPADIPPVDERGLWQRTKDWLKEAAKANARRYAVWVTCLVAASVYNCTNGPDTEGDVTPPQPPDFIWPEGELGWVPPSEEEYKRVLQTVPLFSETEAGQQTEWRDGDHILAYRLFQKATGQPFPPLQQGDIGSCVSFGAAGATEMSLAANVALARGPPQKYDSISREAIYGGGRVNIRRVGLPPEGMIGSWAQEWLAQYGAVGQSQGSPPIGPYNERRARQWGNSGVPQEVVSLGRGNVVSSALVTTAEEVKQALANGYFVYICSSVGFGRLNGPALQRDAQGFLKESGTWMHCMFVAGYRGDRRGFLIVNSWGPSWVNGPKGFGDEPEGSFWADWSAMEKIVRGRGRSEPPDSFAISAVGGFKRRLIEPRDWLIFNNDDLTPILRIGESKIAFGWIPQMRAK